MQYCVLGPTGVKVSRICLGTARSALPAPCTTLTGSSAPLSISASTSSTPPTCTATCPSSTGPEPPPADGREPAERVLGRALRGRRDEMVIATKSNGIVGFDGNDPGLSRRHIIGQVETRLRRLETDCIDLYYAHEPDPDTPLAWCWQQRVWRRILHSS